MTRKDYILVAEGLRIAYLNASNEMSLRDINGVGLAASCVANALSRNNPKFDRQHFLAVIRGEKDANSKPETDRIAVDRPSYNKHGERKSGGH